MNWWVGIFPYLISSLHDFAFADYYTISFLKLVSAYSQMEGKLCSVLHYFASSFSFLELFASIACYSKF